MIYALWTYHWRANSIRRGGRGPYDDRIGPVCQIVLQIVVIANPFIQTVLCLGLLGARR